MAPLSWSWACRDRAGANGSSWEAVRGGGNPDSSPHDSRRPRRRRHDVPAALPTAGGSSNSSLEQSLSRRPRAGIVQRSLPPRESCSSLFKARTARDGRHSFWYSRTRGYTLCIRHRYRLCTTAAEGEERRRPLLGRGRLGLLLGLAGNLGRLLRLLLEDLLDLCEAETRDGSVSERGRGGRGEGGRTAIGLLEDLLGVVAALGREVTERLKVGVLEDLQGKGEKGASGSTAWKSRVEKEEDAPW